jgi:hypothetical protein
MTRMANETTRLEKVNSCIKGQKGTPDTSQIIYIVPIDIECVSTKHVLTWSKLPPLLRGGPPFYLHEAIAASMS